MIAGFVRHASNRLDTRLAGSLLASVLLSAILQRSQGPKPNNLLGPLLGTPGNASPSKVVTAEIGAETTIPASQTSYDHDDEMR